MTALRYDPTAALKLLGGRLPDDAESRLNAARAATLGDVETMLGGNVPPELAPLDAGFIDLPRQLLEARTAEGDSGVLGRIVDTAERLRAELDRFIVLGIGGSFMGSRALFEALCHPYHNELPRGARSGPRIYFEGNNLDNTSTSGLLDLLRSQCTDPADAQQRWGLTVISKSGGTLETSVAFRLFRLELERYYGADSEASRNYVVPITGAGGRLRELAQSKGYTEVFPIPDGVGGRFSIFTAVGLLPAAVMGLDVARLLQGAADMTERFRTAAFADNPVLQYVAVCNAFESQGMDIRVLSCWGGGMESVCMWYDQLLSESLGKDERGATPITAVNTRDLHSRGQQHQEGARDKLITNLIVEQPQVEPIALPRVDDDADHDSLNRYAGRTLPSFMQAATEGTNRAYADDNRPTADLVLPQLDEYALGQYFQMMMLATIVEGRLTGINPYGQPGVEGYKQNMQAILDR